jgi:hypothetical protein
MKHDRGKETFINKIIKSNENLDFEFYFIPRKLSIFMITNFLYYVTRSCYNEGSKPSEPVLITMFLCSR